MKDSNQRLSVLLQEVDKQTEIYIYIYKGLQPKTECTPPRGG